MTQANDSILVTPGAGATVATHLAGGKEHQVVMIAGDGGHLLGTKPSYILWLPKVVVGASKLFGDLFNGVGSGKVIEINGIWAIPAADVAVTGVLGVEIDLFRTSAVGTGGTAALLDRTVNNVAAFSMKDTANAAIPAQVTARAVPTGGATIAAIYFANYIQTEETSPSNAAIQGMINLLPEQREIQILTLREGQGLLMKQGTVAGVGSIAFMIDFALI